MHSRNVRLLVAYDGTDYNGFSENADVTTVMGELRAAIERIVRCSVDLTCAGRTDAGVHGWGQVVSGQLPATTDLGRLAHSVNRMCGPSISVREADWVDDEFSARFSATGRTYYYDVWNHLAPNPLLARTSWHVPRPLNLEDMNDAASRLLGEHDFSSFCRRPKPGPGFPERSLVRHLKVAQWTQIEGPEAASRLRFEITATSFCHQMVRSIVGTLVDVGLGRRTIESVAAALLAKDRSAAGAIAPPTGLVLWSVDYSGLRWDAEPASAV
ncbi:MAG: tRNA pseudouridine(38-40) synthase TruA [Ilumatobacteraceae bacterium]|nr:tRNA pseudouridine(38-40) synthase TruA [Ilumatobacteraceae bacterium]